MHLTERFWSCVTYVVTLLSLSPEQTYRGGLQAPLLDTPDGSHTAQRGPVFKPPGGRLTGPGSDFTCDYSQMPGQWASCSTPDNRSCWLRNSITGFEYSINTNYEDTNLTPIGIHRTYYLNVTDGSINADGLNFPYAKMFNATYPGPWIQGCWGDVRISSPMTV